MRTVMLMRRRGCNKIQKFNFKNSYGNKEISAGFRFLPTCLSYPVEPAWLFFCFMAVSGRLSGLKLPRLLLP